MSSFFLDTSALAKRYLNETAHQWMKNITASSSENLLVISDVTSVEMFSVVVRYTQKRAITPATAARLRRVFLFHLQNQFAVIKIDDSVLRALDSLQLACAVRAKNDLRAPLTFASSDLNLLAAASHQGFATDDPNQHS